MGARAQVIRTHARWVPRYAFASLSTRLLRVRPVLTNGVIEPLSGGVWNTADGALEYVSDEDVGGEGDGKRGFEFNGFYFETNALRPDLDPMVLSA